MKVVTSTPDSLNEVFANASALERVEYAYGRYGKDLVVATSFGPTSGVMLRLASTINPDIRVITIRHGYESKETLAIAERFEAELGLNMRIYDAPKMLVPAEGTPDFEVFRQKIKLIPFARAMEEEKATSWLSGVMRHETEERQGFTYAMVRDSRMAIYPILDWEQADAEEYCLAYSLPMNDEYYDPTKGVSQKQECGLHLGGLGDSWTSSGL